MVAEIATVGGFIITFAATQWGVYKYFNDRISRVYSRFDEHKKEIEDKFVCKTVCEVLHKNTADNLGGLEKRIDARFDKFEQRFQITFDNIDRKITQLLSK